MGEASGSSICGGVAADHLEGPRLAGVQEHAGVLEVWVRANGQSPAVAHYAPLSDWLGESGTIVGVVKSPRVGVVAAALALPGRAADGAGDLIPGLTHLTGLCVDPDFQRRGVASALLDFLLQDRRAAGCIQATLWTHGDNVAALRLFERRGFTPSGRTSIDEQGHGLLHLRADLMTDD